jgi:hypothetical protein
MDANSRWRHATPSSIARNLQRRIFASFVGVRKTGYPSEATSSDARSGTRHNVLMPHRETEFEVLLTLESGKITVEIDGILIFNLDASDWKSTVNYFKEAHISSGCPDPLSWILRSLVSLTLAETHRLHRNPKMRQPLTLLGTPQTIRKQLKLQRRPAPSRPPISQDNKSFED